MKLKILATIAFVMCIFLPHSMAASWQEDVDANTQEIEYLYTVYQRMPATDYKSAWRDVPGWEIVTSEHVQSRMRDDQYLDIFRKIDKTDDGVIEKFRIDYNSYDVYFPQIIFSSKDKKIVNRIFNYMNVRINQLTKQTKRREYSKLTHKLSNGIIWKTHNQNGEPRYIGISISEESKDGYYSTYLWKSRTMGTDW